MESGTAIYGESNRRQYDVIIAGEKICTISYNPNNVILFGRNVSRLIRALSELRNTGTFNIAELPELIETKEDFEAMEQATAPLTNFADKVDEFIYAADKIAGIGMTEAILEEDDENLTLFMKAFQPILDEYGKQRKLKTDKYKK